MLILVLINLVNEGGMMLVEVEDFLAEEEVEDEVVDLGDHNVKFVEFVVI